MFLPAHSPMDVTTPAVLLSTISLLMLAYTNRFMGLAALARELHAQYQAAQPERQVELRPQLRNLKLRLRLIRDMQTIGILSLFLFVLCMFLIFNGLKSAALLTFDLALILHMLSLLYSTLEIHLSTRALNIQLKDI